MFDLTGSMASVPGGANGNGRTRRWAPALPAALLIAATPTMPALAARVELGEIGDDAPNYTWCHQAAHKRTSGFMPVVRGRSLTGDDEVGRLSLAPASRTRFEWDNTDNVSSRFRFSPTMGSVTGVDPITFGVRAKQGTPPGLYYVEFLAVDSTGAESERGDGCAVEIVAALPDVEVSALAYDPPVAGVSGRDVRMTIRNKMPATARPLAGVPWSIAVVQTRMQGMHARRAQVPMASGLVFDMAPQSTVQVVGHVSAPQERGVQMDGVVGLVDPLDFLGENVAQRGDNSKLLERYPDTGAVVPGPAAPPAHTCEPGTVEVDTEGGTKGCVEVSGSRTPRCNGFWDSIRGMVFGSCVEAFRCELNRDCEVGHICPQSGENRNECRPGHSP